MTTNENTTTCRFDASALPVFAPNAALRQRILDACTQQRQSRRRRALFGGGALAASVVLASVLFAYRPDAPSRIETAASAQDESRGLEREWQRAADLRNTSAVAPRVRAIDAELQAAYDRGANARELSTLWARRNAALRRLIEATDGGIVAADDAGLTRI